MLFTEPYRAMVPSKQAYSLRYLSRGMASLPRLLQSASAPSFHEPSIAHPRHPSSSQFPPSEALSEYLTQTWLHDPPKNIMPGRTCSVKVSRAAGERRLHGTKHDARSKSSPSPTYPIRDQKNPIVRQTSLYPLALSSLEALFSLLSAHLFQEPCT